MDTPMVNGTAYPYLNVQPTAYRFRILNACNDRYLNLSLFLDASGGGTGATATATVDTILVPRPLARLSASRLRTAAPVIPRLPGSSSPAAAVSAPWATATMVRRRRYRHHGYQRRHRLYLRSYRHRRRHYGSQDGAGGPDRGLSRPPGRRTAGMAACRIRPRRAPRGTRSAPKAASCRGWRCSPTSRLTMTTTAEAPRF